MFSNLPKTQKTAQEQVLDAMAVSRFVFHLTGSRFFGTNREDSDYDFFVEDDHYSPFVGNVRSWLISEAFYLMDKSDYLSTVQGINDVYQHVSANIQVQVVQDATKKQRIQDGIKNSPECMNVIKQCDKSRNKGLWEALYIMDAFKPAPKTPVNKILMIKNVRELSGCGLKEAKDFVEGVLIPNFNGTPATMEVNATKSVVPVVNSSPLPVIACGRCGLSLTRFACYRQDYRNNKPLCFNCWINERTYVDPIFVSDWISTRNTTTV